MKVLAILTLVGVLGMVSAPAFDSSDEAPAWFATLACVTVGVTVALALGVILS